MLIFYRITHVHLTNQKAFPIQWTFSPRSGHICARRSAGRYEGHPWNVPRFHTRQMKTKRNQSTQNKTKSFWDLQWGATLCIFWGPLCSKDWPPACPSSRNLHLQRQEPQIQAGEISCWNMQQLAGNGAMTVFRLFRYGQLPAANESIGNLSREFAEPLRLVRNGWWSSSKSCWDDNAIRAIQAKLHFS